MPSKTLTIVGNGAGQSIINTNKTTDGFYNRVFTIVGTSLPGNSGYSVKVVFKNLTVTGGEFLYPPASKTAAQGGGLSINGADVTLTSAAVSDNSVNGNFVNHSTSNGGNAQGGGIYLASGSLTLLSSSVVSNKATGGGGLGAPDGIAAGTGGIGGKGKGAASTSLPGM